MALETKCQTPGATYMVEVTDEIVKVGVKMPFSMKLTEAEALILENNLHNVLELVLAPYFNK